MVRKVSWSHNIVIMEKCKNKIYMEYVLKQTRDPIGVVTYQLRNTLQKNMKAMLSEPKEILKKLKIFEANK